ncbi:histidine kinase N-terminal 7TM domain-containing protein [Natronoglomus mannanivorans]|uniref:histidine kinase n=1 Tax=Natronoglomus mannanivorans TaxID=2979990 RepID=A0AAP2YV35_9EURY|nr:ATP-binding protein [Halobacteria archaeon AArc-xg1-1]
MLYRLHLIGLLLAALVSILAAWWVRRQTRDRVGTMMVVLLLSHGTMALLAVVQLLGSTASWQIFWYRLWYLFGLVLPIVWFLLAVYYVGREHWLTKPVWAVVLASPIVPVALWITDPYHGLFVAEFVFESDPFDRVVLEETEIGLTVIGVLFLYWFFAFGLFLRQFLFPRRTQRWQAGAVLGGFIAIFVTTALTDAPFVPAPGFPYSLYGGGIFGALVALALFRTQLFSVSPLAHETIFESIEDAILVVDADRSIADFNEIASNLFPDLEDRIGDTLDEAYPGLVADDDTCCDGGGASAIIEQLDRTLDTPFAGAVRVSTPEKSRTLRINVSEITSGGEPRGYALIMRDVTELEQYTIDLEHKTDQLERFASVLSHDLRNPVSIASGYVELTRETGDLEHLEDVTIALERMDETIEDLLTLSREGDAIDETDAVTLRSLVADAWTTSDTQTLTLENEIEPEYRIRTDPSRLRTLLENLFRNAADHGAETVRVERLGVETRTGTGAGTETGTETETANQTGFIVSDDGPGIPEAERERVLEYGYSSADGTGIGLAIVSSVVTAHGWSLSVGESDQGGAQFTVSNVERVLSHDVASVPNDD